MVVLKRLTWEFSKAYQKQKNMLQVVGKNPTPL